MGVREVGALGHRSERAFSLGIGEARKQKGFCRDQMRPLCSVFGEKQCSHISPAMSQDSFLEQSSVQSNEGGVSPLS